MGFPPCCRREHRVPRGGIRKARRSSMFAKSPEVAGVRALRAAAEHGGNLSHRHGRRRWARLGHGARHPLDRPRRRAHHHQMLEDSLGCRTPSPTCAGTSWTGGPDPGVGGAGPLATVPVRPGGDDAAAGRRRIGPGRMDADLGLPVFDETVGGERGAANNVRYGPYRQTMTALRVEPAGCVAIEASCVGVASAKAAGAAGTGRPSCRPCLRHPGWAARECLMGCIRLGLPQNPGVRAAGG